MKVVGIDIGTSLGWAVVEGSKVLESGQIDLHPHSWEGIGMRGVRASQAVVKLLDRHPGAVVAIELVRRHAGTQAAQVYGGILLSVTSACEEACAAYTFVSVQEAKLAATDNGAAEKDDMVAAALKVFGITAEKDEADAIWIGTAALRREGDPTRVPEEAAGDRAKRKAKERRQAAKAAA
jgi:Holliday junction resolvasome RuvABC endonuclease subunit